MSFGIILNSIISLIFRYAFLIPYTPLHLLTHTTAEETGLLLPLYHITFLHKDSFSPHPQEAQY